MKKSIIIIIALYLIIIITIVGLIIGIYYNRNKDAVLENTNENIELIQHEIKPVSENIEVFTVQKYIQKYLEQININNELYYTGGERLEQSIISKWTYSFLSKEYIEKNSITEENVYEYVNKVEEYLIFVPLKINVLSLEETTKYAIHGFTQTDDNEYREDVYFILNVDVNNSTYSIEPLKNIKSIKEIELTNNNLVIEPNRYNTYEEQKITDEYICEQYLNMFKRLMLVKTQESYNYLNSEYKNKKFSSIQEYMEYVTKNKDKITQIGLNAYNVNNNTYVCNDQWNNYYVFNVNEALDYDVMLDIYTIDVEAITPQYNSSSNENKVAINVKKIESAINNKDYKFVYNKLNETFRNNNFQNLNNFENYMNENFFDKNNLKYESISNQADTYIYKVKLIDVENEESVKDLTIIMRLLEGTDFVFSFNIQ